MLNVRFILLICICFILHIHLFAFNNSDSTILKYFRQLKDSGNYDSNKNKINKWTEYWLDSTYSKNETNVIIGADTIHVKLSATIIKACGEYQQNKKNGFWQFYEGHDSINTLLWVIQSTCEYINGIKSGWERLYNPSTGKIDLEYFYDPPKKDTLVRKYFENGNIHYEAVIKNKIFQINKEYFENGILKQTLIIDKNGDEIVQYYDEKGILIQKRISRIENKER